MGNTNGSIEFEVSGIQEDTEEEGQDFFPVAIEFVAQSGVAGVDVSFPPMFFSSLPLAVLFLSPGTVISLLVELNG